MNLMEGLLKEINRAKEIKAMYDEIPEGVFGSVFIQRSIVRAELAIGTGDITEMISALADLKDIKA